MPTIAERVNAIISEELGVREEAIASDASLARDLGADSMDAISLTLALEQEFAIEIADHDAEQLQTVRQVVDYIQARVGEATA